MSRDLAPQYVQGHINRRVQAWFRELDQLFFGYGAMAGLAALAMPAGQEFAWGVLVVIGVEYVRRAKRYHRFLRFLVSIRHPAISTWAIIRDAPLYWSGLTFLLLVALGAVTPEGLRLN